MSAAQGPGVCLISTLTPSYLVHLDMKFTGSDNGGQQIPVVACTQARVVVVSGINAGKGAANPRALVVKGEAGCAMVYTCDFV
jgi:hypothetical protein